MTLCPRHSNFVGEEVANKKTGPRRAPFFDSDQPDHTGMFCCATMQYSMPIENMVLKRLA
jgi:hypothetical protein